LPKGGTHWNNWAAARVVQQLIRQAELVLGKKIPALKLGDIVQDDNPTGPDADLANTLNLSDLQMRYPTTRFDQTIDSGNSTCHPKVFWVGSSFSWNAFEVSQASEERLFSELEFGYYYSRFQRWNESGRFVDSPGRFDSLARLGNCDLVVLEINESTVGKVAYVSRFAKDAMVWLRQSTLAADRHPSP
jgi:hypothetical protein